jgi:hypothetical protein
VPLAERVGDRQEEEVPIAAVHELTAVAAIEAFEHGLALTQEGVPAFVVPMNVAAPPEREVQLRKIFIEDDIL